MRTEKPLLTEFDNQPLKELTIGTALSNRASVLGDDAFIHYGPADRTVSFAEMNKTASAIGNSLLELGIRSEDKVSVMMRHPLQTLFAMFGINKAGAVYSPINFEYEGDVLAYQLNDTNPEIFIIEDRYAEQLNEVRRDLATDPHVVVMETDEKCEPLDDQFEQSSFVALRDGSQSDPDVDDAWYNEAGIVYTSGTTGRPKGVVLPHRWIFANYTRLASPLLTQDDVIHTSLPLYHVGGVYYDIMSALVAGCPVALWNRFSPHDFWDRVEKYGATRTTLLSVMMPWLMRQPEQPDDAQNTLKWVHMQPLPNNYDELAERFGFDFVSVGFGQTESGAPLAGLIHAEPSATPDEYYRGLNSDELVQRAKDADMPVVDSVPHERYMGRPQSPVAEVAILDENDEEVPVGKTGELAVRPKDAGLVLKEYYGKPQQTVEAFGNLWFHTGDAAYRDEDDNYYFVDRMGDVIRRRGENISSFQIQDTVNSHKAVAQAAVYPIEAPEGGEDQIGAAVEIAEGVSLTEDELLEHLTDNLPDFMVPDQLLFIDEIPTTETNKIEKYKLRQHTEDRSG